VSPCCTRVMSWQNETFLLTRSVATEIHSNTLTTENHGNISFGLDGSRLLDEDEGNTTESQVTSHSQGTSPYDVPVEMVVLLSIFYGAISLVAVLGNSLVIIIVVTSRRMQTVTNYFIANLALADVVIGLFAIPFQFQAALLQRWNLPYFMCPFCPFFQNLSVNASIFTLTAIAVDRYKAIIYPLSNHASKQRTKIILACIWLVALGLAIPQAVAFRVYEVKDESSGVINATVPQCLPFNTYAQFFAVYTWALCFVQYFVPLVIIGFAYLRISVVLWGSKTPGAAQDQRDEIVLKNKKKVVKVLIMVVILFTLAWLPLQAYYIGAEIFPSINSFKYINILWFCAHWLAMSNSCYNPFIYVICHDKFKREYRVRFKCCFKEPSPGNGDGYVNRCRGGVALVTNHNGANITETRVVFDKRKTGFHMHNTSSSHRSSPMLIHHHQNVTSSVFSRTPPEKEPFSITSCQDDGSACSGNDKAAPAVSHKQQNNPPPPPTTRQQPATVINPHRQQPRNHQTDTVPVKLKSASSSLTSTNNGMEMSTMI